MGSPLGPTTSEFYMSHIENKILKTIITKPKIYVRNVDDIFIATHSNDNNFTNKQVDQQIKLYLHKIHNNDNTTTTNNNNNNNTNRINLYYRIKCTKTTN